MICILNAVPFSFAEDGESVPINIDTDDTTDIDGDDSVVLPVYLPDEEGLEEEILEARTLQYGDEGDDVLELQMRLQELNYYSGKLSGLFREGTRDAVEEFQMDFSLPINGIADIQTQAVLYAAQYRPLRYGSSGDDVKDLQIRLMELGYYKGKTSGNYLEGTQKAVREFQERNRISQTGVADADTQAVIYSSRAVLKSDVPATTPTPVPDLSGYLVNDEDSAENSIPMPEKRTAFEKKLKNGSKGKSVKELQTRLTELGYYDGPISGNYAVKTTRAIKAVQTQNGLKATGVTDEETWDIIFNNERPVLPQHTPKPTPEPTPVPYAITVDVENQVTTVYGRDENGEYTVVVRQMLCSTGMKATPSDVGDWVLNGRHAKWCNFPKWGSYARYWTRINASIAFHSVIYYAVDNSCMNVSSYERLGHRASHGCVRLTVADAKWIYDNVGEGTVVTIREDMEPDPELRDALKLAPLGKKSMTPIETPVPTPEPIYDNQKMPDLKGKKLKKGSESEAVFWVQCRLHELGFYNGKCSGKFMNGTMKALKAFQKSCRMYPSGEVDEKTLKQLFEGPLPAQTPKAVTTPAP